MVLLRRVEFHSKLVLVRLIRSVAWVGSLAARYVWIWGHQRPQKCKRISTSYHEAELYPSLMGCRSLENLGGQSQARPR